ncbi:MAG: LacI family transcriptional regulator [Propionibacteriaceae bacterium]|jgi:DNA-binding LacI/PurR family transcriptional regulator|nr:LacI family transcriptional regulator [Propionibacteriaceae bacterium]
MPKRRPTIADVAREAGVAKSAVSYALNDKPGVSPETRARILKIAAQIGWQPSSAARALMNSRVWRMGLVLNRPAALLGLEPYYMELTSGLQEELAPRKISLVLQLVSSVDDEMAVYRDWAAKREVDAVIVTDVSGQDPRLALLAELELPGVVMAVPSDESPAPQEVSMLPWVWADDTDGMRIALRYLHTLGHRNIARVAGVAGYSHTIARTQAMKEEAKALGIPVPKVVHTDYSQEAGARATRSLLIGADRPTAIVFDNDVMTAAALQIAAELSISVPGELSVISWDDSMISRLTTPRLTSVKTDVRAYGMHVARVLNALADGEPQESAAFGAVGLEVRDSTAAPRS